MAYPKELRIRIVKAYENKQGSIRELAGIFHVSKSFVEDMLKLSKETRDVKPKLAQRFVFSEIFNVEGVQTSLVTEDTVNGDLFLAFVEEFLVPEFRQGDTVIVDNYSIHLVEGVQEAVEEAGAQFLLLPRYSPDLSPIEEFWSKVKNHLRKAAARTKETLSKAIVEAFDTVTLNDIQGWFKHCGYCLETK